MYYITIIALAFVSSVFAVDLCVVDGGCSGATIAGFGSSSAKLECKDGKTVTTSYTDADDCSTSTGTEVETATECTACSSYVEYSAAVYMSGECSGDAISASSAFQIGFCLEGESTGSVKYSCSSSSIITTTYSSDDCSGKATATLEQKSGCNVASGIATKIEITACVSAASHYYFYSVIVVIALHILSA